MLQGDSAMSEDLVRNINRELVETHKVPILEKIGWFWIYRKK
jgi:hypothetical protein